MSRGAATGRWVVAALVSIIIHGAGLAYFGRQAEGVLVAGGGSGGSVSIGNSLTDMMAGNSAEPVTRPETVEPVETPERIIEPVEQTDDVSAAESVSPEAIESETAVTVPAPAETVAALAVDPVAADAPAALTVSPVEEAVPLPEPVQRPPAARMSEPQREAERPVRRAVPKPKPAQQQGNGAEDARRGAASARQARADDGAGSRARTSGQGNASMSNYNGLVWKRLNRALRRPSGTNRISATVTVEFVIAGSGHASAVRVVKSSGNPVLDRAAIATVQRASPFPPLPAGTGRSSWPITVPIVFERR